VFSEDCGTYIVIAKNMGGEARTSCHLSLVEAPAIDTAAVRAGARRPVKPLFVQPLENRTVLEGNHTRLECVVTGYPEPEVKLIRRLSNLAKAASNARNVSLLCRIFFRTSDSLAVQGVA